MSYVVSFGETKIILYFSLCQPSLNYAVSYDSARHLLRKYYGIISETENYLIISFYDNILFVSSPGLEKTYIISPTFIATSQDW